MKERPDITMLRISKIIDYGTLILSYMGCEPDKIHSASHIAQTLGLGHPTVSKVLKQLNQQNIVVSTRGAHGGYSLARPAEEISIAQIIDALDDQPFGLTERSEEHTSELQSRGHLVCRLLLEKKK